MYLTLPIQNFKSGGLHFLKIFTIKKNWDGLPVFSQMTIYHVRIAMQQSLYYNIQASKKNRQSAGFAWGSWFALQYQLDQQHRELKWY